MAKITITWNTTTIERFKLSIDESKLPDDWRDQIASPTAAATSFLGAFEWEHEASTAFDEDVLSRDVEYAVLDDADFVALGQALIVVHTATFVPSVNYPNLFNVLCSCGESSFGAMLCECAEGEHARHAADPAGGHFRDQAATARLFGNTTSGKDPS